MSKLVNDPYDLFVQKLWQTRFGITFPALILVFLACFVYGNKRSLELEPLSLVGSGARMEFSIEVPSDLKRTDLFLVWQREVSAPFFISLTGPSGEHREEAITSSPESFRHQIAFSKMALARGTHKILITTEKELPEVQLLEAEYRQTAFAFLKKGLSDGDPKLRNLVFSLTLTFVGLMAYSWLGYSWLATGSILLCFLNTWMITPPMMGYDDTFHLPGLAKFGTNLDLQQIRMQTVELMKAGRYMNIHHLDLGLRHRLENQADWCPHMLAFPAMTVDTCVFEVTIFVQRFGAWIKAFSPDLDVANIEKIGKLFNFACLGIFWICFAVFLRKVLKNPRGDAVAVAGASLFFIHGLVPQSMGVTTDFYVFLVSSLSILFLGFLSLKVRSPYILLAGLIFDLLCMKEASFYLLTTDHKRMLFFVPPVFFALAMLFRLLRSDRALLQKRGILVAGILCFLSVATWFLHHNVNFALAFFEGTNRDLTEISLNDLAGAAFEVLRQLSGTLVSGKVYLFSALQVFAVVIPGILIFQGIRSAQNESELRYLWPFFLVISIWMPLQMVILSAVTGSDSWAVLRFSYSYLCAPMFFAVLACQKNERAFVVYSLTSHLISIFALQINAYWMAAQYYP